MPKLLEKTKAHRVTISLPISILTLLDTIAKERAVSRSFVIVQVMEKLAQERLEIAMRDGYMANYELVQQMAEEDLEAG